MALKRCVLEVTFYVNGRDLTYAKISFTDLYIYKTVVTLISQRGLYANIKGMFLYSAVSGP